MPVKNDWCITVAKDLKSIDINLGEAEISDMKKSTFKKLVSEKIRESARIYLANLQSKHSKSKGLRFSNGMQPYLTTVELSTKEKQLLFSLRTNTFDCKSNFSYKYGPNIECSKCKKPDTQEHLLLCEETTSGLSLDGIRYSDIFGNLKDQVRVTKIIKEIADRRKT